MSLIKKKIGIFTIFSIFLSSIFFNIDVKAEDTKTFEFTGYEQQYTVPESGIYKLEVFGGSGGNSIKNFTGAKGGYASGYFKLHKGETLYVNVGGKANGASGGYNGGGNGVSGTGGGGGATHIALSSIDIYNLTPSNIEDTRLVTANGGTGATNYTNGNPSPLSSQLPSAFGMSGSALSGKCNNGKSYFAPTAGGGAGYYGSMSNIRQEIWMMDNSPDYPRGFDTFSGISYSSNALCDGYNNSVSYGINSGNGSAKITFVEKAKTEIVLNLGPKLSYNDIYDTVNLSLNAGEYFNLSDVKVDNGYYVVKVTDNLGNTYLPSDKVLIDFEKTTFNFQYAQSSLALKGDFANDKLFLSWNSQDNLQKYYVLNKSINYASFAKASADGGDYEGVPSTEDYIEQTVTSSSFTAKFTGYYKVVVAGARGKNGSSNYPGGGGNDPKPSSAATNGYIYTGTIFLKKGQTYSTEIRPGGKGITRTWHTKQTSGDGGDGIIGLIDDEIVIAAGGGAGQSFGAHRKNSDGSWQSQNWMQNPDTEKSNGTSNASDGTYWTGNWSSYSGNVSGGGGGGYYGGATSVSTPNVFAYNGTSFVSPSITASQTGRNKTTSAYATIQLIETKSTITDDYGVSIDVPDKAAPNKPYNAEISLKTDSYIQYTWKVPEDNGTSYRYFLSVFNAENENFLYDSNIVGVLNTSGVKGYYFVNDDNVNTKVNIANGTYISNNFIDIDGTSKKYVHVATVDYAGNLSDTYTFEVSFKKTITFDKNNTAYNINGDLYSVSAEGNMDIQFVPYNEQTVLNKNLFTRENYVFKGWNTEPDGSEITYSDMQSIKTTTDLTLYAIWQPISYFVVYDGNGAVNTTMPEKIVNYDESFIAEQNRYEYSNFNFISWNTKPDGSGTVYMPGDTIKNLTTQQNEIVVLYAIWEIKANKKYTLTVKPNKGIFENSPYDKYFYYIPDPSSTTSFSYTGKVQTYTVSSNGYYFLEAFGASGGADACPGGNGGYVKSFVYLEKGQTLYITVGGAGWTLYGRDAMGVGDSSPAYNGGGRAGQTGTNGDWSGVGGGATSIATALYGNGELENYTNHRNDILVVAGGGGGGSASNRGLGGTVLYAGSGDNYYVANGASTGLLRGDKNPNGQDAGSHDGGGGGGGFVGGVCGWDSGAGRTSGGGASFVNSSRGCYSFILTPNARAGHGFVRISRFDTSGFKVLEAPTRLGYTFDYWKNYGDGKLNHDNASNLDIVDFSNADTTVEAQWMPNTYYVIYKNYDGKGNDFTQTCTYDQTYNYLDNPDDLDDSIFIGWYNKENPSHMIDGSISGNISFMNLTPEPFGKVYIYGKWSKTNLENADKTPAFIQTSQIKIDGNNIYKDPKRNKTYFIKNNTLFSLSFNGLIDSDINTSFLPFITNVDTFETSKKETSINNNDYIFNKDLNVNPINTISVLDFSNQYSAIRKDNSTPGTNKTLLNYKQGYTLNENKDAMLIEIVPHSTANLTRTKNSKDYITTYVSKDSNDKSNNIFIECDSTKPTIINDSIYDIGSIDYNPLISEKRDLVIRYADFVKNVDPSNPKYGSGVNTKNIKLTITQEQNDDGKASVSKVYTDSAIQEYVSINANDLYTGTITLHIDPEKYSDMSGFITFNLEITDNVGNMVTKEYRILVMNLKAEILNIAPGKRHNANVFAQGENGQIQIETNGFIDKVDIKFPSVLDNLSLSEKSNAGSDTNAYWDTGRVLSDTYPRDENGTITTVFPQMQTKLWGTAHRGGMEYKDGTFTHSYLTHYFYAPLYSENGKYPVNITIFKTDPKNNAKIYKVSKTYDVYIGINSDATGKEIEPITEEFRDEIKDN